LPVGLHDRDQGGGQQVSEGGGRLLSVPHSAASPSSPTGVDLQLWRPDMGQCWSSRADLTHLSTEGRVRRQAMERALAVGRMPSYSRRGPRGGGGGVSNDNGEAHLGGSVWRAPRRWCVALCFTDSPLVEV
jgi:hypothetical protein